MSIKKIVLLGYMGSGKSTVARLLSEDLSIDLTDLDDFIEKSETSTITDIFKSKGEIYFRKKEYFYLKQLLNSDRSMILSVGGGTPCYSGNIDLINKLATSVYLRSSVQSLYNRLIKEKNKRPLIAHIPDEDLKEFIAKHLFEREPYYEQAEFTVDTDDKTPQEIVLELSRLI
ncbi:MAG: shikimate kinase [Flavobacteriia bacterium]|nr:MAG: shikimate kinase [Flavobacteriia bacterium]